MAVAWPQVRAALVAALPGIVGPEVTVYDGPVISGDTPTAYATVAYQQFSDEDSGGTFTQSEGPDGFTANEEGSVLCELGAMTGDSTVPDAFTMYAAMAAYLQANPTLGVFVVGSQITVDADVRAAVTPAGAWQVLLVSVNYTASLP